MRSISIGLDDGREVLIPTVVNGKVVSNAKAIAWFKRTGQYLGVFDSIAAANRYAQALHVEQEHAYVR